MKNLALAVVAFSLIASTALAQSEPPAVKAIADHFFTQLKSGQVSESLHTAFKETEPMLGTTAVEGLVGGVTGVLKTLGPIKEWSVYRNRQIAADFIEVTYFLKCANIPAFATLQFYNPDGKWRIIDLRLNTYLNARTAGYIKSAD